MTSEIVLLLAEDEMLIQISLQDALETGGYKVIAASSGAEAMAILEERHSELAGLITDIRVAEGPKGWELGHRARELNPAIGVVYITGDSAADWPANGVPKSTLLQKPFADAQLVTAVSTLLNDISINPPPPESA